MQAPEVATIKMSLSELKLNPWTSNGFLKFNVSWVELKMLPYKLEESIDFPTSYIKFWHWMQKLQHFELNFQTMCEHLGSTARSASSTTRSYTIAWTSWRRIWAFLTAKAALHRAALVQEPSSWHSSIDNFVAG